MQALAPRRSRKPAIKQAQIASELRGYIIHGKFLPGSRIPNRRDLEDRFQVSTITVQRALDQLIEEGFVHANGSQGTYVTDDPPNLSRIGLVFPFRSNAPGRWPQFWTALAQEAAVLEKRRLRKLPAFYYASDSHGDVADFHLLCRTVERDMVGGLIFVVSPANFTDTIVLNKPNIPRVCIGRAVPSMPSVRPDMDSFFDRALTHLAERGCRRVAVLGVPGWQSMKPRVIDMAKRMGMECRSQWIQTSDPHRPEFCGPLAHLLMDRESALRPDGLIISDDNLVEHALGGVLEAGVRVPQELTVVAHCNFPWPTPSAVPITRLGFDARKILATALERIGQQRQGQPIMQETSIAATFQSELTDEAMR